MRPHLRPSLVLAATLGTVACRARPDRCGDPVTVAKAFVDSMDGSGFKFTNPNAAGSCGCGKSFSA